MRELLRDATTVRANGEPHLLRVTDDDADDVLESLSSETTRCVVQYLCETTATPNEIADATDTSLQNVNYHLKKLVDAGLVESVGSRYSEKRTEMQVYALKYDPLVVVVGQDQSRDALRHVLGTVGASAIGLLVATAGFKLAIDYLPELLAFGATNGTVSPSSFGPPISPVLAFALGGVVGMTMAAIAAVHSNYSQRL